MPLKKNLKVVGMIEITKLEWLISLLSAMCLKEE